MRRGSFLTILLSSSLVSLALTYTPTPAAADQSNHGTSVSAGGVGVSAGMGGASVNAGGVSVNAGRSGASVNAGNTSVSAGQGGASVSAGNTSVSANQGGASVSAGNTSVSAGQGGASVSAGNASVSAGQGGASVSAGNTSVSAGQGGASISTANASVSGDRSSAGSSVSANTVPGGGPVGDRSYPNLGAWFSDLRSWWSGEPNKPSHVITEREETTMTTRSSADQETESSGTNRLQVNRVVQKKTAIADDGGSAEASNVNVTKQTMSTSPRKDD